VSEARVRCIWHAHGLKPHLVKTFKVPKDQHFVEKVKDLVGHILDPPERARGLCCHEKTQIQVPDRTQPGLPLKKARAQTLTPRPTYPGAAQNQGRRELRSNDVYVDLLRRPRDASIT
jgi:hypothetical protein